ncbi:MAG: sulfatase [Ardenticatenales bacterium]
MTATRGWLCFGLGTGLALAAPARSVAIQPNIVFIMADDLDVDLGSMAAEYAPNIHRLIADEGVTLDRYYVSDSLCCPSRTTYLRGQYTHNHGVFTNGGDSGGYAQLRARDLETSTLATWLTAAGYRTGLFGKYINGYPLDDDPTHVPPGWSDFVSPAAGNAYGSYNYTLNDNGTLVAHGRAADDYITDVIAGEADDFIAQSAKGDAPFFAFVVPYAPHVPAVPAPRHAALFPDLVVPRTASYNEADVSDKPAAIADRPLLNARQMTAGDDLYRMRIQSMQAVDELVARLVGTLEATGELANTLVVFTSDNGFHIGQHRLPRGKTTAYEEDIHVPFYARGPGIAQATHVAGTLIGNVDIAPTLATIAGAAVPSFVDGRSFAGYLTGDVDTITQASPWRQGYLIEQYPFADERGAVTPPANADRGGLLEPPDDVDEGPYFRARAGAAVAGEGEAPIATYIALRTDRYTYVEYESGERELYDNVNDPQQLTNIAASGDPLLLESLATYAPLLHACHGQACRSIETTVGMVIDFIDTPTPTVTATPAPTETTAPLRVWLPIASNGAVTAGAFGASGKFLWRR